MSWDQLVGQEPAKRYLRSVLQNQRLGHAYLFQGPPGVGKRTAAYIFAQIMLCPQRPEPDRACGECKSCRWFASRVGHQIDHPDVINLLKFGSKGTGEDGGRGAEEKLVGDHEPIIRLESIQHVCQQLHRSPMSGDRRAVIIPEAQRLCRGQAEPANAFLKTLEEPPRAALILMTTSQPEALLETIISRVQIVQFRRLSHDEIRRGLEKRIKQPGIDLNLAAGLADGSLGRALELLEGDLKSWRGAVLSGLERMGPHAAPQFGLALWTLADAEGKRLFEEEKAAGKADNKEEEDEELDQAEAEGQAKTAAGWKRYVFRRLLEVCEICFRDGLMCAATFPEKPVALLQPDQEKLSASLAMKFGTEGCERALLALRESLLAVRLYVRGDVVGRALAGKLVDALTTVK